jgi:hypothetical protein
MDACASEPTATDQHGANKFTRIVRAVGEENILFVYWILITCRTPAIVMVA